MYAGGFGCNGAMTLCTRWISVQCVNIQSAIVEAFMIFKFKSYREVSIAAGKLEAARCGRVLASDLSPVIKLIQQSKDRRGGYYRFNHVCTIVAWLVVRRTVRQRKRQKTPFRDGIVERQRGSIQRNGDGNRRDVYQIKEELKVTSHTNVGTAINQRTRISR